MLGSPACKAGVRTAELPARTTIRPIEIVLNLMKRRQVMGLPPETTRVSPVTKSESDDDRNKTAFAISSGLPNLFRGVSCLRRFLPSSVILLIMSVTVAPGHTTLTFTVGPRLMASALVSPMTPAFDAE